jgi:hypothetical protein
MGADLIAKTPGQLVNVTIDWTGTTKDSVGAGIAWTYRLATFLITGSPPFPVVGPVLGSENFAGFGISQRSFAGINVPAGAVGGEVFGVRVELYAKQSSAAGEQLSTWQQVGIADHLNAIRVSGGAAVPGGSIGSVAVSQRRGF